MIDSHTAFEQRDFCRPAFCPIGAIVDSVNNWHSFGVADKMESLHYDPFVVVVVVVGGGGVAAAVDVIFLVDAGSHTHAN